MAPAIVKMPPAEVHVDIVRCINCHTAVIPKQDHACPSCGRSVVESAGPLSGQAPDRTAADDAIAQKSCEELDGLIAIRRKGIRISQWWMAGSALALVVVPIFFGAEYVGGILLIVSFISGLIGFLVDRQALARLQVERAMAESLESSEME